MKPIIDCQGLFEFAPRVEDAPIVHFGGPWQITLSGQDTWHIGRKQDVVLVVGTPGVGPGTTTAIAYENVIPAPLKPKLDVTFPSADGTTPLAESYELSQRCCGINLHGDVAVPANVPPGVATVRISLPGWAGTTVAATEHDVQILPALPGPKTEPISSRLVRKLQHQNPSGTIQAVHFSPDGNRLIAGDNPGGVVHVWDVASGERLATFDLGKGPRQDESLFVVTPDWKKIIAPTVSREKTDRVQRDGKMLKRVASDGSLRVWDLESGNLLHTWQDDPPRSTNGLHLLPPSNQICALEGTPGEFESARPRAVSQWDVATGEHKQLFASPERMVAFSPDGKQAVVSTPRTDGGAPHDALAFYDTASWQSIVEIPLQPTQQCYTVCFSRSQRWPSESLPPTAKTITS